MDASAWCEHGICVLCLCRRASRHALHWAWELRLANVCKLTPWLDRITTMNPVLLGPISMLAVAIGCWCKVWAWHFCAIPVLAPADRRCTGMVCGHGAYVLCLCRVRADMQRHRAWGELLMGKACRELGCYITRVVDGRACCDRALLRLWE
ncbi:hypothetical protein GH714_044037 [Hevea brasiliensis]|uniref:Uncharacterized protein n=1 Tax=Hevea brasiliensis TaxID=3981 RepID=A0A6A6K276_HEVBR|nr:hypothetical protein GH714_044037 [Hevea brasiliensis]